MNEYQLNLYADLLKLTQTNEAFFFKDFEKEDRTFRVFNYRLASYGDFCLPSALECRGIMFQIDNDQPIRLSALPMEKFFNLYENPFTENPDLSKVVDIMSKEDGSLISTYAIEGDIEDQLFFKTKGSLNSDQVFATEKYFFDSMNRRFHEELRRFATHGYTVNMEWTSPDNRIVLGYEKDTLTILNVRNNYSGEYIPKEFFKAYNYNEIYNHWVKSVPVVENIKNFIDSIPSMEGIEGFVVRLEDGQKIKIKTDWYLVRHKTKDSVNSPRRLFEAIISEAVDDIRSLFHNDPISIKIIDDMVNLVEPKYNGLIKTVEAFYADNKPLTRKDYAIKAQGLDDGLMGLYMNLYIGRENDYKEFAIKNYKMFIGDMEENLTEDSEE